MMAVHLNDIWTQFSLISEDVFTLTKVSLQRQALLFVFLMVISP